MSRAKSAELNRACSLKPGTGKPWCGAGTCCCRGSHHPAGGWFGEPIMREHPQTLRLGKRITVKTREEHCLPLTCAGGWSPHRPPWHGAPPGSQLPEGARSLGPGPCPLSALGGYIWVFKGGPQSKQTQDNLKVLLKNLVIVELLGTRGLSAAPLFMSRGPSPGSGAPAPTIT